MKKTTVYLSDRLKTSLEALAEATGRPEAEIIRDAIARAIDRSSPPKPRLPLSSRGLGDPRAAEKVEDHLRGFGSR